MPDLGEIHRLYLNMIFRICSRYSRNTLEAQDLTQETFLVIQKGLRSFRGDSQLGTWIYRLTTNCCLNHLRKKKREDAFHVQYLDSLVIRNLVNSEDRVLAKVDLDRILAHLRPVVRRSLFLCLAEGLSYREASEVVGISREAVAKIVSRFLKKRNKTGGMHGVERHPLPLALQAVPREIDPGEKP